MSRLELILLCGLLTLGESSWSTDAVDSSLSTSNRLDAARQLVRATSAGNILRIDAGQAALIAQSMPEEVPAELRSTIGEIMDRNLSLTHMENNLGAAVASAIERSDIDRATGWWNSAPGRAIANAEAIAYADALGDKNFANYHRDPYHRDPNTRQVSSPQEVNRTLAMSHFVEVVQGIARNTDTARSCIAILITSVADCPPEGGSNVKPQSEAPSLEQQVADAANQELRSVPEPDLRAYGEFLRAPGNEGTRAIMASQLRSVSEQSWNRARQEIVQAIDGYARSLYSNGRSERLTGIRAQIEASHDLNGARVVLELMRRAAPDDADVLIALTRLVLRESPNLSNGVDPSIPVINADSLGKAQELIGRALSKDPNNAEGLMFAGFVAYLKNDFDKSIDLITKAQTIGTNDGWLHVDLGDAYWAKAYTLWATSATQPPAAAALMKQAVAQYQLALKTKLSPRQTSRAIGQLAQVYTGLKDIPSARQYHLRYVLLYKGTDKANALVDYSRFLLFDANDVDGAVFSARRALVIDPNDYRKDWLRIVLWVRAGTLIDQGKQKEAALDLTEAKRGPIDVGPLCNYLAMFSPTFPGLVGLHAAGVLPKLSGSAGGLTLVRASRYADAKDIERLIVWGADPNYFDTSEGAPLHVAILGNNAVAVKVLLTHGADPLMRLVDGRLPTEIGGDPRFPIQKSIVDMVAAAAERRYPGYVRPKPSISSERRGPAIPLKVNYRYHFKEPFRQFGHRMPPQVEFTYFGECWWPDDDTASCLRFREPKSPPNLFIQIKFPYSQWPEWQKYIEEIGPTNNAEATGIEKAK